MTIALELLTISLEPLAIALVDMINKQWTDHHYIIGWHSQDVFFVQIKPTQFLRLRKRNALFVFANQNVRLQGRSFTFLLVACSGCCEVWLYPSEEQEAMYKKADLVKAKGSIVAA